METITIGSDRSEPDRVRLSAVGRGKEKEGKGKGLQQSSIIDHALADITMR